MAYKWVTGRNFSNPTGTSNPNTGWRTPSEAPITTVSVPSYGGHGDVLVRTEVSVSLWAIAGDVTHLGFFPGAAVSMFLGDVGASGASPLNPWTTGAQDFAFSWERQWSTNTTVINGLSGITPTYVTCSTGGYVTSKARRGPDSYGGVTPFFNLAVVTRGSDQYVTGITDVTSTWVISVRCLWQTA